MTKTLIAYYSRRGQNYSNGRIVDLQVGNTEVVARMIAAATGGDLFEIDTVKSYPVDYTETTEVATQELRADARPELRHLLESIDEYDTIYLGYPNWWATFPMAVATFLESYDFEGKTILPFCTHEGSGMGRSEAHIARLATGATVANGLALRGSGVAGAEREVNNWIGQR